MCCDESLKFTDPVAQLSSSLKFKLPYNVDTCGRPAFFFYPLDFTFVAMGLIKDPKKYKCFAEMLYHGPEPCHRYELCLEPPRNALCEPLKGKDRLLSEWPCLNVS